LVVQNLLNNPSEEVMPDLCSSAHCCEKGAGTRAAKPISFVNKKIDLCDLRTAITLPSLSTTAN
jgi:hypothetical protein